SPALFSRGAPAPSTYTLSLHDALPIFRSLDDCRRIIAHAGRAGSAVVVGASFIGMEVAASLRARGLPVTVVEVETVPFARTLGPDRKSTRLNSSHVKISYAVFCLKKKT